MVHAVGNVVGGGVSHPEPVGDVVEDVHVGKQRVVLKDEAHPAIRRRHVRDVVALNDNASGVRFLEPGNEAESGRLAASAGAQEGDEAALVNRETHGYREAVLVCAGNTVQRYHANFLS